MSYADVRHWYEDPPDEQDLKDADIRALKKTLKEETGLDVDALQEFVDFTAELKDRQLVQDYPGDPDEELAAEEWRNTLARLRTAKRDHTPSSGQRDRDQPGGTPPGPSPTEVEQPQTTPLAPDHQSTMVFRPSGLCPEFIVCPSCSLRSYSGAWWGHYYGSYQCPYCQKLSTLEKILAVTKQGKVT